MKIRKSKTKRTLWFSLALFILSSCSSTRNMQVLTTRPANISVSKDIKKIVVINRSKGSRAATTFEGILTGELPGSDASLALECIRGLEQTLVQSTRFQVFVDTRVFNSGDATSTAFGKQLEWNVIEDLCREANADAVLALEFFDSDFMVEQVTKTGNAKDNKDKVVVNTTDKPLFYARGTANVKGGFRIYDPRRRVIVYDNAYSIRRQWTESAATYLQAAAKLLKRNDALRQGSFSMGSSFARQIIPTTSWEGRLMYKLKDPQSKQAERLALTKNWADAASTWENAYNSATEAKTKSRIAYNLALANEVLGNLQEAKRWITQSYTISGDKKALRYSNIISGLISDAELLKRQLEE